MAKRRNKFTSHSFIALFSLLMLLLSLFPVLPLRTAYAAGELTLSKSIFSVGYPTTTVTVTGSDLYLFRSDTEVLLYDQNGQNAKALSDVNITDSHHLTFTLQPGLNQGKYTLVVKSYQTAMAEIDILTNYDPTHVVITPGANRDMRLDWNDPNGLDLQDIKIEYALIDQAYNDSQVIRVPRGKQTYTLTGLDNNKAYKFRLSSELNSFQSTAGSEYTNGGQGYLALDTTPPGDLTDIQVTTVTNGLNVTWKDPVDPMYPDSSDLNLVTVQYAEHGTSNWSDGFVVTKGVQKALIQPLNLAKRYDFRFTKTDIYGNWSYQLDTHNGYGYSMDNSWPSDVSGLTVSNQSDTSEVLTWTDPADPDFHHVNLYLSSDLTPWVLVGRADKGTQTFTLDHLTTNIHYTVKAVAVDTAGNESPGVTSSFQVHQLSDSDFTNLTDVTASQQVDGGLQLKWNSDTMPAVDFNSFRVYYAPVGTTDPKDYKVTPLSNESAKTASLEAIPTGTYILQLRFYDAYGVEENFHDLTNEGAGYYVSGTLSDLPSEVGNVKIQPDNGQNMQITWTAATSNGTQVKLYVAEQSSSPSWQLLGQVDIRDQRYTVQGLRTDKNYEFKLIVVDTNKNTESEGVVYNNSGFGYNLLGGDTHPPHEVTDAQAVVELNDIAVNYTEPTDPDFDSVNIYIYQTGSSVPITHVTVPKGQDSTSLHDLLPGQSYTLKITTVDTVGNESSGVTLDNNGQGYTLTGTAGTDPNEVRDALLIPQSDQLTVRFLDPLSPDYDHAVISIKKAGDPDFSSQIRVNKGTNTATFYNLDSNALYQVRILAYTASEKQSNGIYLGGNTGISLLPLADVTNAKVTPGNHRLTVSWSDPTETLPSDIQVEFQEIGSTVWYEPKHIQPGTGKAILNGLLNDTKSYRVRISTVLNGVASPGVILENSGAGYSARNVSIAPNPQQVQSSANGQVITINGQNTRFSWLSGSDSVTLLDPTGQVVSGALSGLSISGPLQMQVTLKGSLTPGTYTLVVDTPQDGELQTTLQVLSSVTAPVLSSSDVSFVNNNYSAFSMVLTGTGFTPSATVTADNGTALSCVYQNSQQLLVTIPQGFKPGTHKLYVTTDNGTSNPLGFNVYAFTGNVTVTAPTTRTGLYHAQVTMTNLDANMRSGEVLIIIRRNGEFMESKTVSNSFLGNETKQIKFDFGGNNTPYANGPTQNINIQAYIADGYSLTPLSEPITYDQDLNL